MLPNHSPLVIAKQFETLKLDWFNQSSFDYHLLALS